MESPPKPWFDLKRYREIRLREALFEVELAEAFLREGLYRNAAGKAFQAWKALVAAYASERLEEVRKAFPGFKRLRDGRRVEKAYWVLAIAPTTALKRLAQIVGGEVDALTDKALHVHEYQYNGPDPQGVLSPYPDDSTAQRDVETLMAAIRRLAGGRAP